MISAFFTGVVVAIPTSLVMMRILNSSLFINNSELADMNQKISVIITQLDDYREEREKLLTTNYTERFGAMETAMTQFNSTKTLLENFVEAWKKQK